MSNLAALFCLESAVFRTKNRLVPNDQFTLWRCFNSGKGRLIFQTTFRDVLADRVTRFPWVYMGLDKLLCVDYDEIFSVRQYFKQCNSQKKHPDSFGIQVLSFSSLPYTLAAAATSAA